MPGLKPNTQSQGDAADTAKPEDPLSIPVKKQRVITVDDEGKFVPKRIHRSA